MGRFMKYTELKIGDAMPLDYPRGIVGAQMDEPRWYPLRVAPLKEQAAALILNRAGVRAFFPREVRSRVLRGKRKTYKHPQVTQIIYAKFKGRPNWDVMQARKIITGVYCIGTTPIVLPPDVIRVVQGLPTSAERIQAAKEALMRVHEGERVKLSSGAMAGFLVDVTREREGRVWWQYIASNGLPVHGECGRDGVEKLDVA